MKLKEEMQHELQFLNFKLVIPYANNMDNDPLSCQYSLISFFVIFSYPGPHMLYGLICPASKATLQMSHLVGKPTICIGENKDADQLRGLPRS